MLFVVLGIAGAYYIRVFIKDNQTQKSVAGQSQSIAASSAATAPPALNPAAFAPATVMDVLNAVEQHTISVMQAAEILRERFGAHE